MAQTTVQREQTKTVQVSAMTCDICSTVFAIADPEAGRPDHAVSMPDGSACFWVMKGGNSLNNRDRLDLCTQCAGVTWDWLQERKTK